MKIFHFLLLPFFALTMPGCNEQAGKTSSTLRAEDFEKWDCTSYGLYSRKIRHAIDSLQQEQGQMYADEYVRQYYASGAPFLWITRSGVNKQADSLLYCIEQMPMYGIPDECFYVKHIKEDLRRIRHLDFNTGNGINTVFGRIEYHLTKAFLRYACGQQYGCILPERLLNRLEKTDTTENAPFRRLYDIPTETADEAFIRRAISEQHAGRLTGFLRKIQPADPVYHKLAEAYRQTDRPELKEKIAANIERSRWKTESPSGKYVWVNLAGMNLVAVNEHKKETLEMNVCGGSLSHKSPMLTGKIERMDLNPYWIVPYSIIKKEIAPRHAQSEAYFSRNRIRIFDKETKEEVDPATVTAPMLTSGRYRLRQDNGDGNSLGRIIFRFPNNFSVFLHDTDNKNAFKRDKRAISHGCIRVEKPLELALFLWECTDGKAIDKLRTEIGLPPLNGNARENDEEAPPKPSSRRFDTPIPIFIDYYTVYPNTHGKTDFYPDIYGYDEALLKKLKTF